MERERNDNDVSKLLSFFALCKKIIHSFFGLPAGQRREDSKHILVPC
jgi:hypothetical protein